MNATTVTDTPPLPRAVQDLLRAFSGAHRAELRLFVRQGAEWHKLYPADGLEPEAWSTGRRVEIEVRDSPPFALEVRDGAAFEELTGFLVRALGAALTYEQEARSAARELTERYEEINLLYYISEILADVISLPEAATRILSEVADNLGARRASLWVCRPGEESLRLAAAVGEEGMRGPIPVDDPESATAYVFRTREGLNLERGALAPALPRLEPRPQGREAFLSVPISYTPPGGSPRTVGVLTLVGRRSNVRFSAGDARLLTAVASQIGAALETQRLVEESLRQERMVRELELAHDLQLKLLPDPSEIEGPPDVAARCVPAESVGGDFYQLFRLADDRLGITIGDVSSHGFPAALIMALTMSAVAISAREIGPPAEVLKRVHRALAKELESTEMYLTLFYGVLDLKHGRLCYSNAGHPHAFHVDPRGSAERLRATDLPMGMIELNDYHEAEIDWTEGDLLLLFTDGISDALAVRGAGLRGEAALVEMVADGRDRMLDDILDTVFQAAAGGRPSFDTDDRTVVLVRG